jgi:phosphoribosylpyrophosphate synthetase
MTNDEQNLIIELTERFKVIYQQEYLRYFLDIIRNNNELIMGNVGKCKKYYVIPLLSKEDIGKVKSSSFLWYGLKTTEIQYESFFSGKELLFREKPDNLSNKINDNSEAILILIDDYIGSGETAVSAVEYCMLQGIKKEKIVIIVLAAQEIGLRCLKDKGLQVYTNICLKRGINDYYQDAELKKAIKVMMGIEQKINVSDEFLFGYKKSEALISLSRTPNNTFPIFWLENTSYKIAPFPR